MVGPKPKIRLVRNDGPVSVDWASIVTPLLSSRLESSELFANDGTWVEKLVVDWADLSLDGNLIACLKVPWIESPVEAISFTLLEFTCARKVGLYGIRTRGLGFSVCEAIQKLSASRPSNSSPTTSQR